MARLVFDIETSALPLEQFDEVQQEYLFREADKLPDETARAARCTELQRQFNLWPFTAQVVCIAMLNADSARGKVLFLNPEAPAKIHPVNTGKVNAAANALRQKMAEAEAKK